MEVNIDIFPETKVVAVERLGSPAPEYDRVKMLVAWKLENRLQDQLKYRSYGIHYTDPRITPLSKHRIDFCLSFDKDVGPSSFGISDRVIPELLCARARDISSRSSNKAATYLYETWLPRRGESPGRLPISTPNDNVGPNLREEEIDCRCLFTAKVNIQFYPRMCCPTHDSTGPAQKAERAGEAQQGGLQGFPNRVLRCLCLCRLSAMLGGWRLK